MQKCKENDFIVSLCNFLLKNTISYMLKILYKQEIYIEYINDKYFGYAFYKHMLEIISK